MANLVKGQTYFVTEYDTKIENKEFYSLYRAKYLYVQKCPNEFVILTNKNWIGQKRIDKGVCVIPARKIIKMDTLKDITNEILPNDMLMKIDEYL
jgi:hypothetical protein